ncbi:MAG TPA: DUF932 domain-containing protein [Terracidiphilus sp.]|nr:DUF932 domain-containing protein [Terracidiphilus sp.]
MTLMAHTGTTDLMTREQLAEILPPEATDTHKPIAHIQLVNSLLESLSFRHINVVKEEFAVSQDGMKLFGCLDLETMGDGFRFSLGLRNANDKSMRLGLVVGVKILVCDNLAFHGDFEPVLAKHSKHFDLNSALAVGLEAMQRNFKPMADQIQAWRARQLTDGQAKETIYRAFIEDELDAPKHLARVVHKEYFEPSYPEFAPRTAFSLQNAFTSAFKLLDPIPMYKATASLGEFFSLN